MLTKEEEIMNSKFKFNIGYFLVAFIAISMIQSLIRSTNVEVIPYSKFHQYLGQQKVSEITIKDNHIQGRLKESNQNGKLFFSTNRVEGDLVKELDKYNVKYTREIESNFFRDLLGWVLPTLIFFGFWMFLMRRMNQKGGFGSGLMTVGKSKAKVYVEKDTKVTFGDVAGVDEAKHELVEVVNFLKETKKYTRLGAHMPKGVLLVGPPGTGKTLIAKAVAGEAGVPFFSISGSEFVEMFVGVGAARVRDLFEQAKKQAPAIIFIDELDALGKSRGHSMGGNDEKEQTLNQLLVELDGFESDCGIVLLGATNRPEILDPALLRAGRFDRQVLVDRPDKEGRIQILKVHIKKIKFDVDLDLEKVAGLTPGFTGADLANLVNEAAIMATRRDASKVELEDFNQAVERIIAGLEKRNRLINPFERKVVAYHEMGHAIVAEMLPGSDPVSKISIIPRSIGSLGYTIQRPTEDRFLMTKEELENKMAVLLGGRASELLTFNHLSTGASDDISRATDIAMSMLTQYGMDQDLGSVTYKKEKKGFLGQQIGEQRDFSEATSSIIDQKVKELVDKAFAKALDILKQKNDALESGAQYLLANETMNEEKLKEIIC